MSRHAIISAATALSALLTAGCLVDDGTSPAIEPVAWETHAPAKFSYVFAQSRQFGGENVFSVIATPDSVIAAWSLVVSGPPGYYQNRGDSVPVTGSLQQYSIGSILAYHAFLSESEHAPDTLSLEVDSVYGYPHRVEWRYAEMLDVDGYIKVHEFVVLEP